MKAIIYARVSTSTQVFRGNGLASQIAACEEYALENGIEVVDVVTDAQSGSTNPLERDGFSAIAERADAKTIVLADRIDRIARDADLFVLARLAIEETKSKIITVADGDSSSRDDAARIVTMIKALAAESERRKINRNVRQGMQRARRDMKRVSRFAPFGFEFAGEKLTPLADEFDAAVQIIQLKNERGISAQAIANIISARGHKRRDGKAIDRHVVRRVLQKPELISTANLATI